VEVVVVVIVERAGGQRGDGVKRESQRQGRKDEKEGKRPASC